MPYRAPGTPRQPEPHERPWVFAGAATLAGLAGIFGGGLVGALAFARVGVLALAPASAGCYVAGSACYAWRHARRT